MIRLQLELVLELPSQSKSSSQLKSLSSRKIQRPSQLTMLQTTQFNIDLLSIKVISLTISKWFKLESKNQDAICWEVVTTRPYQIACINAESSSRNSTQLLTTCNLLKRKEWDMQDMATHAVPLQIDTLWCLAQERKSTRLLTELKSMIPSSMSGWSLIRSMKVAIITQLPISITHGSTFSVEFKTRTKSTQLLLKEFNSQSPILAIPGRKWT